MPDLSIEFPKEGVTTGCNVKILGEGLYQLCEHPVFAESAQYGDTIKAKRISGSKIQFTKVVQRSGLVMHDFVLPKNVVNSAQFDALKTKLNEHGIFWQQDFSGLFLCFSGHGSEINIRHEIALLCR